MSARGAAVDSRLRGNDGAGGVCCVLIVCGLGVLPHCACAGVCVCLRVAVDSRLRGNDGNKCGVD